MNCSMQFSESLTHKELLMMLQRNVSDNYTDSEHISLTKNDNAISRSKNGNILLDMVNPTNSTVYMTASMFRNVTVPFICIFGGIGNSMALATLLYRKLRHTSCNTYLALRSISDTLFLLTLMAVWFDSVEVPFFHTNGVCQIVVFISYVTSFLSVWSVAAITFENFIRICYPTKLNTFCTIKKAKKVVIALVIVSVMIYQSSLWITAVVPVEPEVNMCMTRSEYERLYVILTYIDIAITLLIPLIVILSISTCIIFSVVKSYRRRLRLRGNVFVARAKLKFSATPQAKVTRLLFAVSLTFLILHTPIHMIKLVMIVKYYILEIFTVDPVDAALKTVFENMYYLNFSANFVVFFICGEAFRKVFWELFCKCCTKQEVVLINVEQQTDLTYLNGSRKGASSKQRDVASDSGSDRSCIYRNALYADSSVMLLKPCVHIEETHE